MKKALVIKSYRIQYHDPIKLQVGDTVFVGEVEKEEKWRGWIWANTPTHQGWIPIQIIAIAESRNTAIVKKAYSAQELDVDENDEVIILETLNGWCWAINDRTQLEGWIPYEIVDLSK